MYASKGLNENSSFNIFLQIQNLKMNSKKSFSENLIRMNDFL